jgi:ATP-dependent helicase/nuclease subunit A
LGLRYRRLLVDEFQDTDPIQAEILFLLASEPEVDIPWQSAVPRPGALFVVGDPKQSIYRFRRADISVYNQVKSRFREFGAVLHLVANFRSTLPIAAFVNSVFDGLFPTAESAHQAGFAPLSVNPHREGGAVHWHRFEPAEGRGRFTGSRISLPDTVLTASWVQQRIDDGARPGEFMILTWTKSQLSAYARALEARNIPVQVAGAGVGMDHELAELILLLRALGDPGDPVLTVAVLEGLFYGLSHEDLHQHSRAGGGFSFLRDDHPPGPVGAALRRLRGFWQLARCTRPEDR